MGDPQGDLRPGTPILVDFFTEISKKMVLDSKSLRISFYVAPPTPPLSSKKPVPKKNSALKRKIIEKRFAFFLKHFVSLPTLPREIAPPKKLVFCPDGQFQGRGGTISRESRGQPLLSLLHTKTATPLQYEKLSPPHFFPQGGQFQGGGSVLQKLSPFSTDLVLVETHQCRFCGITEPPISCITSLMYCSLR